jgi:cation:H+ antiporter
MFLSLSADNIVSYAVYLSKSIGIEQSFIGVLIIGIATGLPELTTAIEGIRKKSKDMSLGVLIGSNITNPLMGVGIGALIIDNPISKTIVNIDLVSWFLISFALYLLIYNKKVIPKKTGIIMVCLYVAFIIYKINFII